MSDPSFRCIEVYRGGHYQQTGLGELKVFEIFREIGKPRRWWMVLSKPVARAFSADQDAVNVDVVELDFDRPLSLTQNPKDQS